MSPWRKTFHTVVSSLLLFTLLGCATAKKSGFIADFDRMKRGKHLERFRGKPDALTADTLARIQITEIDVSLISDSPKVTAKDAAAWLKEALVGAISKREGWGFMSSADSATSRMSLAITQLDPGDQAARIIAGELGAGNAFVQIEGRLLSRSGEEIAAFVDRRRSSGLIGIKDNFGDAGPDLIRKLIQNISADIVAELGQFLHRKV